MAFKTRKESCQRLLLLVGSNPLPNYLAAVALEPGMAVLAFTPESEEPCDRLCEVLKQRGTEIERVCIQDATQASEIEGALENLRADHLHYSGGTKPMAAHARMRFREDASRVSYIDERKGLLRFEDGYDHSLAEIDFGLSVDLLLRLHGGEKKESSRHDDLDDARKLLEWVLPDPRCQTKLLLDHLSPLTCDRRKKKSLTQAKQEPISLGELGLQLSESTVPGSDWNKKKYELWRDFLCGEWLEVWVADVVRSSLGEDEAVEVGLRRVRDKTEFEIDVCFVRGHRLYVISCTTDSTKGLCKSKLFEVALRARQMGGDLAHSAIACLLDNEEGHVDQLQEDIRSIWDAPNIPRVFGRDHLREWAGCAGPSDTSSLSRWLEQPGEKTL